MLKDLDNGVLISRVLELVKVEKQTTLQVLEYLAEIDSRKAYLKEGYASLFDFCVRYLNYSESEALRRIQSARVIVKVEEIKPLLQNNELSLTGLSLMAPFINKENAESLLSKVKHQPVRQIEKVLEAHFPEVKVKKEEFLNIILDDELKDLIAKAKVKASEHDAVKVLKRALREFTREVKPRQSQVQKHTRYVSAKFRRELTQESGHQCTFKSASGVRCNQTAYLQIDHVRPWAMGGSSHEKENLRVLCRAHNQLLAREYFSKARGFQKRPV